MSDNLNGTRKISFRLSKKLYKLLYTEAVKRNCTVSELIRDIIVYYYMGRSIGVDKDIMLDIFEEVYPKYGKEIREKLNQKAQGRRKI